MSVYKTILDSVKDAIDDLALLDLTCVVRKRPVIQDPDECPIVVVSPGTPSIDSEHTENTIVWVRPVWITIATPTGDGLLEESFDDLPDYEEDIRQGLHETSLAGATSVFDSDISPDSLFIPGGVDVGYDMTIFRIDYLSTETRSV